MHTQITNIATIGGGTGHYALLRALMKVPAVSIASIVSVTDNGKSSGELRDELGVLPPGDCLKVLLAMTGLDPDYARELLLHRFEEGRFRGHTNGNLLLSKHAEQRGFMSAIEAMRMLLCVEHTVLPVSLNTKLHINATLSDDSELSGEHDIDMYRGDTPIRNVRLNHAHDGMYPPVFNAIRRSDFVIVSPGSLHTSLLPVLKTHGIGAAFHETNATRVFVCNTMTQKGDTHGMCPHAMTVILEDVMHCPFDLVLCDNADIPTRVLLRYAQQNSFPMRCNEGCSFDELFMHMPLSHSDELVRHNFALLASALEKILT